MNKSSLRKDAAARRMELARALPDFAQRIVMFAGNLGASQGAVVSGYWPIRDEADPRGLMGAFAEKGHVLALPRVAERAAPLVFHRWRPGDATLIDMFGLTEPLASADIAVPSLLLVPLLAFDAAGYRLGYGGGYYDRTLAGLRADGDVLAVGVAYAGQEVAAVPHHDYDQRLDMIVTENGVRRFTP
ncbi:MAG: 5-formyltetrahydrofolate cyclo-ligase [Alphaproteobacteria bacterium]|nr:5-formyltetrahydrofolate cyclo-ligase [Alphaproteobacteria bacterium]MDE1985894.1 5-formyltetrahydrofolate cyclo-ligase [Alphaproteobacteria bacterium]MDE2163226.1 5-formyltetrahydrofolate cyclo-ligase [Alphaproteobacteria bacterium]MDE2266005.1 5-formyltetrahydrofolate cyclo-ligase [Alphaproteobacteria bacterium]MDE2499899.1 5-formyltetrahydrofolate cyclo-ligase [Alphaproteobacteria bacterium]